MKVKNYFSLSLYFAFLYSLLSHAPRPFPLTLSLKMSSAAGFPQKGQIFRWCCKGDLEMAQKSFSESSLKHLEIFNRFGFTPLHSACFFGRVEIVKWIAEEHLSSLNILSRPGNREGIFAPPIHYAICNGHREVVSALLEAGADPFIRDYRGYNALGLARLHGNKKMIRLVQDWVQRKNVEYSNAVIVAKSASLHAIDGKTSGLYSHATSGSSIRSWQDVMLNSSKTFESQKSILK
jgi:ankyrin repeat protein